MKQWLKSFPEQVLANIPTLRLLGYNSHICYVSNINALFEAYRCPSCDHFLKKAGNLDRHLTTCNERVSHILTQMYQLCETLFYKLDPFGIPCTDNQKLFNNISIFDFESICVVDENFKDTETTTWIEKHIPISVSKSSNLIKESIFVYNPNSPDLLSQFIDASENLATQSKAQLKKNFLQKETATKSWLALILKTLNQGRSRWVGIEAEVDDSGNSSTQFLQTQKNQLIDLQEHFERQCKTLPVFGFNKAR